MTNFTDKDIALHAAKTQWKESYREALANFIAEQPGDLFATLTFNSGSLSLERMRLHLKRYLGMLDRRFIHDHYYKLPAERRTRGVFYAEKLDTNSHWHGIVRFPPARHRNPVVLGLTVEDAKNLWKKVARKGNAVILPIEDANERVAGYISKEFWMRDSQDQLIFAADLHRSK